jgi:hypothetical protein
LARRYIASWFQADLAIHVWDISSGRLVRRFGPAYKLFALSPDGRYIAFLEPDGGISLRELSSGRIILNCPHLATDVQVLRFSSDGRLLAAGYHDGTILLWNARHSATRGAVEDLSKRWDELAADDSPKAFGAMEALIAQPKAAIEILKDKLKPQVPLPPKKFAELLADLNHRRFAVREEATRKLEAIASQIEGRLERALPGAEQEVAQRLDRILASVSQPIHNGEELRRLRGIEILERIGSPDAREFLRKMTKEDGQTARDARDALKRLRDRP